MNEYKEIYAKLFDRTMTEQEFVTWAYNLFDTEHVLGYEKGYSAGYDDGYGSGYDDGLANPSSE